jgi:hypothetical protein
MLIVRMDLVVLAGQGNLTIPPFAKYTPQPANLLLDTHHSPTCFVDAEAKIMKKNPNFLKNTSARPDILEHGRFMRRAWERGRPVRAKR